MLSRVLHPESNWIGALIFSEYLLFSEYLRSFGERYLDPFFFSPGASFDFFAVLPPSDEQIKTFLGIVYQ